MADIVAAVDGDWSVGATWVGGVKPGAGDNAIIDDGSSVTIDENINVASLTCNSGGGFYVYTARTITANIVVGVGLAASPLFIDAAGLDITFTGNVVTANGYAGMYVQNVNNLTITGNVTGGAALNSKGVEVVAATGDITITGSITAGAGASAHGLQVTTCVNVVIDGNISGGAGDGAVGAYVSTATGDITITGSVTGGAGTGAAGVLVGTATGDITITGSITAGAGTDSRGLWVDVAAVNVTVDGAVTSDGGNGIIIAPALTGNLVIHGNVTAGGAQHAVYIVSGCVNLEVVGDVTGGGDYNNGINVAAGITGTATVTGTVTGGTAAWTQAIYNDTTTTFVVDGDVVSGTGSEFPILGKFQLKSGHKIKVYNDTPALVDYLAKRGRIIGG